MRTRFTTVAALVGAAVVGLGIGVGPHLFDSGAAASKVFDSQHSVRTLHLPGHGTPLDARELARRFETPHAPIAPAAPDPRQAVQRFLDGAIAGNDARSYGQLSAADRMTFPTVAAWTHRRAESARLLGATITSVTINGASAEARVDLRQAASLDEVKGLVPAAAHAVYHVVHEDGGWRIALSASRVTNDYFRTLDARAARAAALAWVRARSTCATTSRWQWRPSLYGDGADLAAAQLCGSTTPVRAGNARPLDDSDAAAPLLAAFGPDVEAWARVVPLLAPLDAHLVLAPVADRWFVVAVLVSSPAGGQG